MVYTLSQVIPASLNRLKNCYALGRGLRKGPLIAKARGHLPSEQRNRLYSIEGHPYSVVHIDAIIIKTISSSCSPACLLGAVKTASCPTVRLTPPLDPHRQH
jgi:hypothetical protein